MTHDFWVSSKRMTGLVTVSDGRIVWTPPIWRKFEGQSFGNLTRWLERQGGLKVEVLKEDDDGTD